MSKSHRLTRTLPSLCRIFLCGFFCLGLPAMAAPASTPETGGLGSLFYSPAERLAMQRQRVRELPTAAAMNDSPRSARIDGLVRRNNGNATVWLNQRPMNTESAGAILGHGITDDSLRIGEILDLRSGRRVDPLPRGSIEIRRQP